MTSPPTPAQSSDGGKTWTYTLKDGIKDQNGNDITRPTSATPSSAVRRVHLRRPDLPADLAASGPSYRKALPDGGYGKKHLPDSVLETPDDKTVVFHFDTARPDLPQTLAMAGYSIVPEKTDTKEKYDKAPVSSARTRSPSYKVGKSLMLVRTTSGTPKTDSVRHQYVDGWNFEFGVTESTQTKRLIADQGDHKNAIQSPAASSPRRSRTSSATRPSTSARSRATSPTSCC